MFVANKWEAVLDQKPVPLLEHLLQESARLFANDLCAWPPRVEEPTAEVAALIAARPTAPDAATWLTSFRLARWDLQREHEAYDDFMRNKRWAEAGLTEADKPLFLFLSRLISEQLLALGEATQGRVNRQALLRVLDLTERAVLKEGLDATNHLARA